MARTDTLGNFLTDVANAIREKKGITETIQASNFDTEITSIEGGGKYAPRYISFYNYKGKELNNEMANLDTSNLTTMYEMFRGCNSLTSLNINHFDTTNVTNMGYMFNGCQYITPLDLSNWNTSKVTNMKNMFYGCSRLESIDMSGFNTTGVTNMSYMFASCPKVTNLDLSNFDVTNVTDGSYMFNGCSGLTSVDLSGWNTLKMSNMSSMFRGCTSLKRVDLSSFKANYLMGVTVSYMFEGCTNLTAVILGSAPMKILNDNLFDNTPIANGTGYIYVPDDTVERYKTEGKWVKFANQFKGYSELPSDI